MNLRSDGVAIGEAALGGDVDDVVWGDGAKSWAIVADAAGNTKLVSWSADSAKVLATLWTPGGYVLTDAERNDRGELWVCDASFVHARAARVLDHDRRWRSAPTSCARCRRPG